MAADEEAAVTAIIAAIFLLDNERDESIKTVLLPMESSHFSSCPRQSFAKVPFS